MKKLFSIFAALLFAGSIMANVGNLYYTLAISQTSADDGGNTSYDGSAEMTVGGMQWSLSGNTNLGDYWAIGGKSLTSKERATYSKTAMGDAIAKIVVSHSGVTADALKVDSAVLIVASDASFSTVTDRIKLNPTVAKNTNGTVEFTPTGDKWAEGSFYKISFFLTNAKNSNYRMPITKIDFFSYLDPNAPSISASNIDLGLCLTKDGAYTKTVELEVVGANLTDAITYTIDGYNTTATGTLTKDGGTLQVTFSSNDATGDHVNIITLSSGTTTIDVTVTASVLIVSGFGTEADPFSAADVVAINNRVPNTEKYWVKGYIVGCATNGGALADTDVATNFALGDAADQTTELVPVELPSGDIRSALNIVDNATNKGKQVKVYGQLVSYFSYTGVKSTSDYAFIEEAVETKYYLKNNWEGGDWVWKEMTKVMDNQYKLENVVFGGGGVNWNTAESDEGASWVALEAFEGDIIKALDTVNLILTPSTGAIYATLLGSYVAPATNTYTVAGSNAALFGTTWDATNTANDMTLKEGTTFEIVYTDIELAAGTVSFKVCVNHAWTTAYPASDYNLTISEGGIYTVTITYDSSTNAVSATAVKTGDAVVLPSVVMHGTFASTEWADTDPFTAAADELTATLTITLEAKDIEFGVKIDGAWTANGATLTRDANTTDLTSGSGNMHLTADVAGDYTFTYTYATKTLAVTFPEAPVVATKYCELPTGHLKDANFGDANGRILLTIQKEEGTNNIRVAIKNNNANGNTKTGLNYLWVNAEGATGGVVRYGDGTHAEADVEEISVIIPFDAAKETYNFINIHWAYSGWEGEWAIDGLTVQASELCDDYVPTAIENNEIIEKAVKFIENGQLFIRKNGTIYNVLGKPVR